VASVDFREDVVGSEALMQRVGETYRTIRNNLFRYVLSNLYDFDPQTDALSFEELEGIDQYMMRLTAALAADVTRWYDEFAFHRIYHRINYYCVTELSAFYFDVIKDRLYISAPKSKARRSAQTAVWHIGEALTRLLAPITTFTSEEVWGYLPRVPNRPDSVHLANFPTTADLLGENVAQDDPAQREDWTALLKIRDEVMKALDTVRNEKLIGKPLEAQLAITAADAAYSLLDRYKDDLRYLFIVSAVTLTKAEGKGTHGVEVVVKKADGEKCERCWNYSTRVGEDKEYPTVCERCSAVLKEIESSR
jgi:isoleucyl-tRNA synthetase